MVKLIYKREGSPYWYSKIPILDANGHVVDGDRYDRRPTKTTDRGEAMLIARQRLKESLARQLRGERENPPLLDVIEEYKNQTLAEGKPDYKNQVTFAKFVEPLCREKNLLISELDRTLITRWKRLFVQKGYAASYVNNFVAFLVRVYNYADEGGLDVSPHNDFKGLKLKTKDKLRYFLEGEEQKFLVEIDPTREANGLPPYAKRVEKNMYIQTALQDQYDLYVFMVDTGVRHSEATECPRSAVDTLSWKYVNIYREKVGNEGTLALTDRLREVLQRRLHNTNSPYIFASRSDPNKPRSYAVKGITKAIDRAGLNPEHLVKRYGTFTPHCFRHTFASRLAQNGLDLLAISKLLGHTSTQMTQRYAHLIQDQSAQRAAEILNGFN